MSQHKKRVYVVVMILGALALFVDRFVLSEGATAPDQANASPEKLVRHPAGSPARVAEDAPAIPELPFPRGVERFTFGPEIPDLFAPPGTVRKGGGSTLAANQDGLSSSNAAPSRGLSQAAFTARYELDGVLSHERLRIAIVGGRWLRLGDTVDGCKLTHIAGDAARFACFDGEAVLEPRCGRRNVRD